jgi:hypothetical protein
MKIQAEARHCPSVVIACVPFTSIAFYLNHSLSGAQSGLDELTGGF